MGGRLSKVAALVGVAASIGIAGPASAAPVCVGTQQTVGICASVNRETVYEDCVYVGPPPCIPVSVTGYDVDCGGWVFDSMFICTF
jgi:hypothetical protein